MDPAEVFRSVGDVWLLWAASFAALGYAFYRACRRISWAQFRHMLGRDEEGASYILPYVLTFPIYMLLVCMMIQTTLILIVKLGTYYSAYAAARSAIVWRSVEPNGDLLLDWVASDDGFGSVSEVDAAGGGGEALAQQRASRAAVLAMAPFASSNRQHLSDVAQRSSLARSAFPLGPLANDDTTATHVYSSYRQTVRDSVSQDRIRQDDLRRKRRTANALPPQGTSPIITSPDAIAPGSYAQVKYKFAMLATRVRLTMLPNDWNADFTATVSYEMPMAIPGAGRLLGARSSSSGVFSRIITTAVTLPAETPQSANRHLGIDYDPQATY